MDIHELVRRLRADESERQIAERLHLGRQTIAKYRTWAEGRQVLTGDLPPLQELHRWLAEDFPTAPAPQNRSTVEGYRPEIETLLERGLGPRSIFQLLNEQPGFTASESAVYRLCAKLRERQAAQHPQVVVRIETRPGEVAQADFGAAGSLLDPLSGQPRKAQVFVMTLGWSRHMYGEFVFDQQVPTWLTCHQHAFAFFEGVPERVVIDNLKAAIIKAYAQDRDPEVQRAYAECAEHYGFLIDPCLPQKPQHKGKVERGGVGYIKQSFLPLLPPDTALPEANRRLRQWLLTTAGEREHGTTHEAPLRRFSQVEHAALQPLPVSPFDPAEWKQVKVHRDGHVVFAKAFYSAPLRCVGQHLWLRAGLKDIRLFGENFELVATHPRALKAGTRSTQLDHLPPEKVRGLTASRDGCLTQAQAIGPCTFQVVNDLLQSRPVDKLRTALRVLRLAETYTPARLEASCARGLAFGDASLHALKHMLAEALDTLSMPRLTSGPAGEPLLFARSADELVAHLGGGASWT